MRAACIGLPATPVSVLILGALIVGAGCSSDDDSGPTTPRDTGVMAPDTGEEVDAGFPDGGVFADAEVVMDAEPADAGFEPFPLISCADVTGTCVSFEPGEETALLDAVNSLNDDTTIVLATGSYAFDNALTFRRANGVTLTGQGMDLTNLDFSSQTTQSNGVDVIGDNFAIRQLTITDAQKDALRIEDSMNVQIQFVRTTWSGGPSSDNGGYGIYPVRCTNVLLEDSEAFHASDAGLYVGQSINVIVRRNVARRNVAGLEIENTQFAQVYENTVEDNTAGLVVFDLPGNPVIGRDVKIFDNVISNNNRQNFAVPGAIVSQIPAGTGTFALASRRVEITNNTYENNNSTDIAILSGLAVLPEVNDWAIPLDQVVGSTVGLELVEVEGAVLNFVTNEIWIHDNTHSGSGTMPDSSSMDDRPLGFLLGLLYFASQEPVDTLLYDGIGEDVDPATAANNTNVNHICAENETGATWATLDLETLLTILGSGMFPTVANLYRPDAPFAPFNCTGFTNGPIADVTLPF